MDPTRAEKSREQSFVFVSAGAVSEPGAQFRQYDERQIDPVGRMDDFDGVLIPLRKSEYRFESRAIFTSLPQLGVDLPLARDLAIHAAHLAIGDGSDHEVQIAVNRLLSKAQSQDLEHDLIDALAALARPLAQRAIDLGGDTSNRVLATGRDHACTLATRCLHFNAPTARRDA